ncbi:hypothetical protein H072_5446 [Dactylellina haptotyla CBS 200.50]|uniref:Uncharacterized protein n=1 Tax=Dactylellina haptotyla (strain CBS 200.50) TaxID=1284197 RepID=S8ACI8_DACHA|nr:hypothetical protein H072_5446 [Dactylellina haptotyla CBS 200.50]
MAFKDKGSQNGQDDSGDINPFRVDVNKKLGLCELVNLRRTVRWFTIKFFQQQLKDMPNEAAPSYNEISRVDNAFCVLWLWMEASYEPTKRGCGIGDLILRVIGLDDETCDQVYGNNTGTLVVLYIFLTSQLEHLGPLLADEKSEDHLDHLARHTFCLGRYICLGIPNLILIFKGLDGVKRMLESPLDYQLVEAAAYFDHIVETRHDFYADFGEMEIVKHFILMIDELWSLDLDGSEQLYSRPLWKVPGATYQYYSEPWCQREEFQYLATFWDDKRLLSWGYRPASEIAYESSAVQRRLESVLPRPVTNIFTTGLTNIIAVMSPQNSY